MRLLFALTAAAALTGAACAPAAPAAPAAAPTTPPAPTATTAPPTATPAPAPPIQPAAFPGQENVSGKLQAVTPAQVTLEGGKAYPVAQNTRFAHPVIKAVADLKKGDFVAITAKLDATDGSLLASQVSIFPPTTNVPAGQRPMAGTDLMTNAAIESIEGNTFTVTLPAGSAKVKLAPNGRVFTNEPGNVDALKPGMVVTMVVNGDGTLAGIAY